MFIQGDVVELETKSYGKLPFKVEDISLGQVQFRCTLERFKDVTRSRKYSTRAALLTKTKVLESRVKLVEDDPCFTYWVFPRGQSLEREYYPGCIVWRIEGERVSASQVWDLIASYSRSIH